MKYLGTCQYWVPGVIEEENAVSGSKATYIISSGSICGFPKYFESSVSITINPFASMHFDYEYRF
jgi:hypothetical protein